MKYTLIVNSEENGDVIGQVKEYPAVVCQGSTLEELQENIQEVLELYLHDLQELGQLEGNILHEADIVSK